MKLVKLGVSTVLSLFVLANLGTKANADWVKDHDIVVVNQNEVDDYGVGVTPEATVFQSQMQVKAKVSSNGTSTVSYSAGGNAYATATYKQTFTFYTLGTETAPSSFHVAVNDSISGNSSGSATTKYTDGSEDTPGVYYSYASSSGVASNDYSKVASWSEEVKPSYSSGTNGSRTVTADPDMGNPRRASISFSVAASAETDASVTQAEEWYEWYLSFSLDAESSTSVSVGDPY